MELPARQQEKPAQRENIGSMKMSNRPFLFVLCIVLLGLALGACALAEDGQGDRQGMYDTAYYVMDDQGEYQLAHRTGEHPAPVGATVYPIEAKEALPEAGEGYRYQYNAIRSDVAGVIGGAGGSITLSQYYDRVYALALDDREVLYSGQSWWLGMPRTTVTGATEYAYTCNGEALDTMPSFSDAGVYTITITATHAHFTLEQVTATLTILPRPVTVTADSAAKYQGEQDPAFTATIQPMNREAGTGLVPGDTLDVQVRRGNGSESVGAVPLTPVVAPNENYDITAVEGALTIYGQVVYHSNMPSGDDRLFVSPTVTPARAYAYGKAYITLSAAAIGFAAPEGFVFAGWSTFPTGQKMIGADTRQTMGGESVHLYARWKHGGKLAETLGSYDTEYLVMNKEGEYLLAHQTSEEIVAAGSLVYPQAPEGWKMPAGNEEYGYLHNTAASDGSMVVQAMDGKATVREYYDRVWALRFSDLNVVYTGEPKQLHAPTSAAPEGVVFTYLCDGKTYDTMPAFTDVGVYTVTATAALPPYYFRRATATLTISPRPVTVTAADVEKRRGESDPEFAYTVEGALAGDDFSVTVQRGTDSEAVGDVALVPVVTPRENYAITPVDGVLRILGEVTYYANYPDGSNPPYVASDGVVPVVYGLGESFAVTGLSDAGFAAPEHYDFAGWSLSPDGAVQYQPGEMVEMGSEGLRLYAIWVFAEEATEGLGAFSTEYLLMDASGAYKAAGQSAEAWLPPDTVVYPHAWLLPAGDGFGYVLNEEASDSEGRVRGAEDALVLRQYYDRVYAIDAQDKEAVYDGKPWQLDQPKTGVTRDVTFFYTYNGSVYASMPTFEEAGVYSVGVRAEHPVFSFEETAATLTIARRPVLVEAGAYVKYDTEPDPDIAAAVEPRDRADTRGLLPEDTLEVTVTPEADSRYVGNVPLAVSVGAFNENYDVTLQDGVLTVLGRVVCHGNYPDGNDPVFTLPKAAASPQYAYGESFEVPDLKAAGFRTPKGYAFAGWAAQPYGDAAYIPGETLAMGRQSMHLYARWTVDGLYPEAQGRYKTEYLLQGENGKHKVAYTAPEATAQAGTEAAAQPWAYLPSGGTGFRYVQNENASVASGAVPAGADGLLLTLVYDRVYAIDAKDKEAVYTGEAWQLDPPKTAVGRGVTFTYHYNDVAYAAMPSFTGAGVYAITITAAHDDFTFEPAVVALTIAPRPVTVTVEDVEKRYGEGDPPLTYAVEAFNARGGSGLVAGETLSIAVRRETAGESVGQVALLPVVTAPEDNYAITLVPGTLRIYGSITLHGNYPDGESPVVVLPGDLVGYAKGEVIATPDIAVAGFAAPEGFGFGGWATTPDGAPQYNAGAQLVMGDANLELYAYWKR